MISSERFFIEDKDGDFVEAKDGILRVGGLTEDALNLPWDDVEIEPPDGGGVVRFNAEGKCHGVRLDPAQYDALLDVVGPRFRHEDGCGDYVSVRGPYIFAGNTEGPHPVVQVCLGAPIRYIEGDCVEVGSGGYIVYMDDSLQEELRECIAAARKRAAQEPALADDYHAAKHDQGKPDPISDLRLLRNAGFLNRAVFASQALDEGNPYTTWADLLDQIPHPHRSLGIGEAMHYGFQKYKKWGGWRDVPDALPRYQAAALRHYLFEKYYPEDAESGIDSESGIPHMSLAACNMAFVLELLK